MKPLKLVMKAVTKHTRPNPTTRVGTIRGAVALSGYREESEGKILTPECSTKALEHQIGLQSTESDYSRPGTEVVHHSQELQWERIVNFE